MPWRASLAGSSENIRPVVAIICEELSDGHIFCFFCIFMTLPEVAFSQAIFFILVKEEIL
jgi:hypothetical protein